MQKHGDFERREQESGLIQVLHREGDSWASTRIRACPLPRSIRGGDCVQEEAKNLEFFVQEPGPKNGLDRAARCTNLGNIHVYSKLMGRGTIFVCTPSSESLPTARTCS